MIVDEVLSRLFLTELFQRICPKDVAHEAMSGRFTETVDLLWLALVSPIKPTLQTYVLQVFKGVEFRAEATMYAEELLVHDRG